MKSSEIGFPLSRLQVLALVERMLTRKNREKAQTVTHGWWASFCRRHPEISLKTSSSLSAARAKASSKDATVEYFHTLQGTLHKSGLINEPGLIHNMDESGFPLEPKPPKTVHRKGDKQPYQISKGPKSQVTVVACVNAAGLYIPPMVLWARKKMNPETFKVKDLHIKPDPAGCVVTSKESIQVAEIKKQERNKKKEY